MVFFQTSNLSKNTEKKKTITVSTNTLDKIIIDSFLMDHVTLK